MYPLHRMRRMRAHENRRKLIREVQVTPDHLIFPVHVVPGMHKSVDDGPGGVAVYSVDRLHELARRLMDVGVTSVYVSGSPENRDEAGTESYSGAGTVQRAVRALKHAYPDLNVMTELSLKGYVDSDYDGILEADTIHNEATLQALERMAMSHAGCGVDMVVPVVMMDGQVGALRHALEEHGFDDVVIVAGAAVYDSAFGSPLAEKAEEAEVQQGEDVGAEGAEGEVLPTRRRQSEYLMDVANASEALRSAAMGVEEGADMVFVSPAVTSLDIIHRLKHTFQIPVIAGVGEKEGLWLKDAMARDMINERRAILETIVVPVRAGADAVVTPFALTAARLLTSAGAHGQ